MSTDTQSTTVAPLVARELVVDRADLGTAHVADHEVSLGDGEVLLKIERFALTSNNVTYGITGDTLGYWRFFPTETDGTGVVPAWGVCVVVATEHDDVVLGERWYGFVPMASHVVVRPGRIDSTAVVDASPHREGLAGTYQRYIRLDADASHDPALLDLELLYRPLFATAFLLAEVLAGDGADDHAASVVITSASSKTGTALAHLVVGGPVEVIGLTSTGNVEHVTGLGLHDRVLAYDELVGLGDLPGPTVLVDLAGRADVVAAVHRALPDGLARHLVVGFTHHDAASDAPAASDDGPRPEMFFAPTHAARLVELWGLDVLTTRIAAAQRPFIASVASSVTVREIAGLDAAVGEWRHLVDGDVDASEGLVVAI